MAPSARISTVSSVALSSLCIDSHPTQSDEIHPPPLAPRATPVKIDTTGFTTPRDLQTPRFRRSAGDAEHLVNRSVTTISMSPRAALAVEIPRVDDDVQPKRYSAPPRLNFDEITGKRISFTSSAETVSVSSSESSSDASDDDYFPSICQSPTEVVLKPNPNFLGERSSTQPNGDSLSIHNYGSEVRLNGADSFTMVNYGSNATKESGNELVASNTILNTMDEFWQDVPGVEMHFKSNAANIKLRPELKELVGVWMDMLGTTYILSAAEWHGGSLSVTSIRGGGAWRYTHNLIRFRRRCGERRITFGPKYELHMTNSRNKLIWATKYGADRPFYWLRRFQTDGGDICRRNSKLRMRHPYTFGQLLLKQYRKCGCWPKTRMEVRLLSRKQKEKKILQNAQYDDMDWEESKLLGRVSKAAKPICDVEASNECNDIRQERQNPRVSVSSVMTAVPENCDITDATPRTDADTPRTDAYTTPRKPTPRKAGTPRTIPRSSFSGPKKGNRISRSSLMTGVPTEDDVIYEDTPRTQFDEKLGCPNFASTYIGTPRNIGTPRELRRLSLEGVGSSIQTKRKRESANC